MQGGGCGGTELRAGCVRARCRRHTPSAARQRAELQSSPSSCTTAKLAASTCHQLQEPRGCRAKEGAKFPRNRCHLAPQSCESGPEQERKSAPPRCQHPTVIYDGWCPDEDAPLAPQPQHTQLLLFPPSSNPSLLSPSHPSPRSRPPCRCRVDTERTHGSAPQSCPAPRPGAQISFQGPQIGISCNLSFCQLLSRDLLEQLQPSRSRPKMTSGSSWFPSPAPRPCPRRRLGAERGHRGAPTPQPPAGEPRARELRCHSNGRAPGDEGWGQRQGEPPGRTGWCPALGTDPGVGWGPWALQIPPGDALRLHVAFWDFADFCRFFPPRNSLLSVCNCQAENLGPASPFAGGQDSSRCQGLWLKTGQGEPRPCRRQHRGCSAHVPGKAAFSRTARLQPPASKCLGDELQAGRPQPRRTPRHRGAPRF